MVERECPVLEISWLHKVLPDRQGSQDEPKKFDTHCSHEDPEKPVGHEHVPEVVRATPTHQTVVATHLEWTHQRLLGWALLHISGGGGGEGCCCHAELVAGPLLLSSVVRTVVGVVVLAVGLVVSCNP